MRAASCRAWRIRTGIGYRRSFNWRYVVFVIVVATFFVIVVAKFFGDFVADPS